MGKIAEPGVNYCDGEPTASLSVNGQIYSTENPPISYQITNGIVEVTDSVGALASVDISGEPLVEVGRQSASQSTNYCSGFPVAAIEWNTGKQESNNPPISYVITETGSGIQVDWGGGDIDILTGETWTISYQKWILSRVTTGVTFTNYEYSPWSSSPSFSGVGYTFTTLYKPISRGESLVLDSDGFDSVIYPVDTSFFDGQRVYYLKQTNPALPGWVGMFRVKRSSSSSVSIFVIAEGLITRVETNTGDQSGRSDKTPSVSVIGSISPEYEVEITDSSGVIYSNTFESEPTGFQAICYDYDISKVSYACTGCPSGTFFECTCPATNTKYCYGFDPDNSDVFKPLFESPIA